MEKYVRTEISLVGQKNHNAIKAILQSYMDSYDIKEYEAIEALIEDLQIQLKVSGAMLAQCQTCNGYVMPNKYGWYYHVGFIPNPYHPAVVK